MSESRLEDLPTQFEVPAAARAERDARRTERLLGHLDQVAQEVDQLREHRDRLLDEATRREQEIIALRSRAAQLDALMATRTMRLLQRPRSVYSWLRVALKRD